MSDLVPWYDLLTRSNRALLVEHPAIVRAGRTGHPLPLSQRWARTLGLWGGQRTAKEMAEVVGIKPAAVRTYAYTKRLTLLTRNSQPLPQAAIALSVYRNWVKNKEGDFKKLMALAEAARCAGVYPIEALYYIRAIPALASLVEQPVDELSEYEDVELHELWLQAKLRFYSPEAPHEKTVPPAEVDNLLSSVFC